MIDVPRSLPKGKLNGFWSGIESLKDGYCWDDRYEFKEIVFDSPVIWVFSNESPDQEALSQDRWQFWHIEDDKLCHGLTSLDEAVSRKRKRSVEDDEVSAYTE